MSRVRAETLVLINWKGVFYQSYPLDPHVTALEGDNGAGKTTVMIALYIVQLPDMTRLRFTNLGESGATGGDKGIWGRLGEEGRPSYSVVAHRLPKGGRVLAGVHLARKGEPSVEPTPFVITDLANDVRLQDVLLLTQGDTDAVPELPELKANVARWGGRMLAFNSVKEYYRDLFDRGISALPLATDEERNKFNDMLRTSMTGGLSRGQQQDLHAFLLREAEHLGSSLKQMQANLDACRRTHAEVEQSQRLEAEISAVYDAGEEMFKAAVAATQVRAAEAAQGVARKEAERQQAEADAADAEAAFAHQTQALDAATAEKQQAAEVERKAKEWEIRVREALKWYRTAETTQHSLLEAEAHRAAARDERTQAEAKLDRAKAAALAARDTYQKTAEGLGDRQRGLDELHRQAAKHRQAKDWLQRARTHLALPTLDPADAESLLETTRATKRDIDAHRRQLEREIDDADAHRAEHTLAMGALRTILGEALQMGSLLDLSHLATDRVRAWRDASERRTALAEDLQQATRDAERQRKASDLAAKLDLQEALGRGADTVARALAETDASLEELDHHIRQAEEAAAVAEHRRDAQLAEAQAAEARQGPYKAQIQRAQRLSQALGIPVADRADLTQARTSLREQLNETEARLKTLEAQRSACLQQAQDLLYAGGFIAPELLRLAEGLGADLIAARFDNTDLDEAGEWEARLGPLAGALVVPDVEVATEALSNRPASLPTVWLVSEDAPLIESAHRTAQGDVVVDESLARRVSRIPERPTLGRAARERRAEELRREAAALEAERAAVSRKAQNAQALLEDADSLLEGAAVWLQGDPTPAIEAARELAHEHENEALVCRDDAAAARTRAKALRPRRASLQALLPDAALLDAPDGSTRVEALQRDLSAAESAVKELSRIGEAPSTLARHRDALRRAPWTATELIQQQTALADQQRHSDRLAGGLEALAEVARSRDALGWVYAEARLAEEQDLLPTLKAQLEEARTVLTQAEALQEACGKAYADAIGRSQAAEQDYARLHHETQEAFERFEACNVPSPTEASLTAASESAATASTRLKQADEAVGIQQVALGRAQERAKSATVALAEKQAAAEAERQQAQPLLEYWGNLRAELLDVGLAEAAQAVVEDATLSSQGSPNLWNRASTARGQLEGCLRNAQGGATLAQELKPWLNASDAHPSGVGYVRAWVQVRDWLRRRLPAQVADVDEPRVALVRFRDHLRDLADRLKRQEQDLRTASADVAQGIDVAVRKASRQVSALNHHLACVRFGSIQEIRIQMDRRPRMQQLLDALRADDTQRALFASDRPFEQGLAELFQRLGGGRTTGQKLLDYREYFDLRVQVRRRDAASWENANPTHLSTGEAIGVGAALMMVVLTGWEWDATLLRGKRSMGSLRLLFLDEANRLDQANLATLFELCRTLKLQLLVAAPEVARAEGCTVFRLARASGENGQQEVHVSGRRLVKRPEDA